MNNNAIEVLKSGLKHLNKSMIRLESSITSCKKLDFTRDISDDKLKELESLSARFARTVDLFTQKVLKTYCIVIGEEVLTFADRIHFAEKIEIIKSADKWMMIRLVRNQIVHDYIEEDLISHHQQIIDLGQIVLQDLKKAATKMNENLL